MSQKSMSQFGGIPVAQEQPTPQGSRFGGVPVAPTQGSAAPAPQGPVSNNLSSLLQQFAGGAAEGLLTLPGAASDLVLLGMDKLGQQLGNAPLTAEDYAGNPLGSNTVRSMFKDYVSPDLFGPEAKTKGEEYARRVGEFVGPTAALGPLNPRTIIAAGAGGVGSKAAQDAAPDSALAPVVGAVAGALAPGGFRRLIAGEVPNAGLNASRTALAKDMIDQGIPIYPGQMGGKATKLAYDATTRLPFMGTAARDKQLKAFNNAIAKTFGESAEEITPAVMNRAKHRLSGEFNDIFARHHVPVDKQLLDDLGDIQARALENLSTPQSDQIGKALSSILNSATRNNGTLQGRMYHAYTSKGGALQNITSNADPNIKFYAGQTREALDKAFARANPEAGKRLAKTKAQFRALKVIEPLAAKASDGNISPALLLGRVASNDASFAYTGGGKLGTLARGAKEFLKEQPSSTTAERSIIYGALGSAGTAGAYFAPHVIGPAAAVYGGARALKALLESRTIGGRMVANALQKAATQQTRRGRLTQSARASLPGAAGVAARQNLPVENRSRIAPR